MTSAPSSSRLFTTEHSHVLVVNMEHNEQNDNDDKCLNGRCWSGPMMLVETKKGASGDLCVALKLFLGSVHSKEMASRMVATLTLGHFDCEETIMACAVGREPSGAVLREICALIDVYCNGTLTTHSASYTFRFLGEDVAYKSLLAHYHWLRTLGTDWTKSTY